MLLEYGTAPTRRILIDGGTARTREDIHVLLQALPDGERRLELMVVTHIDIDHIDGIRTLLKNDLLTVEVGDFWFNGWPHLPGNENELAEMLDPEIETLGPRQGEALSGHLLDLGLPWNRAFGGRTVVIPEAGELPTVELEGGLKLTVLSPNTRQLERLKRNWQRVLEDLELEPGYGLDGIEVLGDGLPDIPALAEEPMKEDTSPANGSSIALLAEYEGRRILLAGDAFPSLLLESLGRISPTQNLSIDLLKLSHHGGKKNTHKALLDKLNCARYLFSTNGARYKHPDKQSVARVIQYGGEEPELIFNYRTEHNEIWDDVILQGMYPYRAVYPAAGEEGISIDLWARD